MRFRLFAHAAALVLVAGGLLVISSSPASAHCAEHSIHPDRYDGGGIFWQGGVGTELRNFPHFTCPVAAVTVAGSGIDVHCALEKPDSINDWVYARDPGFHQGWAPEGQLRVDGIQLVPGCVEPDQRVAIGNA